MRMEREIVAKRIVKISYGYRISYSVSGLVPTVALYLALIALGLWSISSMFDTTLAIWGQVQDLLHWPTIINPLTGCYLGRS